MTRTISSWEPEKSKKKPPTTADIVREKVADAKRYAESIGAGRCVSDKLIGSTIVLVFENGQRINVTMPPGSRTE